MNQKERQKTIIRTSILGIVANLLIAASKIIVGLAVSSIAIISEGINNASDAATSVLTLVGTKLSAKQPDEKHPFGYGRIEYLTGLVIGTLILYTGLTLLIDSVKAVFNPEEMSVNIAAIALIAVSAVIKFFLGVYTMKMGKQTDSSSLSAVGEDCRNDAFISIVTIISSVVFILFHISLDAYAGVFFALIIMKAGFETLKETVADIIGRPAEIELAKDLYKEIRSTEGIINAVDMMLHNYGPDLYSGSVNIEVDYNMTVGEIYEIVHELQLRIMHKYNVVLVFGMYAVGGEAEDVKALINYVAEFVRNTEHIKSYHAIYESRESGKIYCDLIVDYNAGDWNEIREKFTEYLHKQYPDNEFVITIETEYV